MVSGSAVRDGPILHDDALLGSSSRDECIVPYHSPEKPIRTTSGVLELIGRFDFDFRRAEFFFFFERFELLCVQRSITHNVAVHVPVLCPHNSISNVVVSLTIHDNMYIYLFARCVAKNMKPLWKVKGFCNRTSWKVSDVQIVRHTWVLSSVSVCCVLCVSLWWSWWWLWWWCWEERRRGEREEGERLIEPSGQSFPQDC